MLVYNIEDNSIYKYDGSQWVKIGEANSISNTNGTGNRIATFLSYLNSLTAISEIPANHSESLLSIKLEEILVYLLNKYSDKFVLFLQSLVSNEGSTLKKIVHSKVYSNLKIEEIAFLCNMSLSTFKRHFTKEFNESPGKWFQDKRLRKAKEILEQGKAKPSDLYLDFGYNNLSNFSIAFKNKFGISPTES